MMKMFKKKDDGDPKKPKVLTTTTTSKRKALGGIRPRKEKIVEKTYSDYPLKRKNLLKKTTVVNKALPTKDVVKSKTVTNPTTFRTSAIKNVEKSKKVRNYIKDFTKEKKVTQDNTGMFNPLAGSNRRNRTVSKSYKNEKSDNPLWKPKGSSYKLDN